MFITKNGEGDLVVMNLALYEQQQALLELYQQLGEAEAESASDTARVSHKKLIKDLKAKINEYNR